MGKVREITSSATSDTVALLRKQLSVSETARRALLSRNVQLTALHNAQRKVIESLELVTKVVLDRFGPAVIGSDEQLGLERELYAGTTIRQEQNEIGEWVVSVARVVSSRKQ